MVAFKPSTIVFDPSTVVFNPSLVRFMPWTEAAAHLAAFSGPAAGPRSPSTMPVDHSTRTKKAHGRAIGQCLTDTVARAGEAFAQGAARPAGFRSAVDWGSSSRWCAHST